MTFSKRETITEFFLSQSCSCENSCASCCSRCFSVFSFKNSSEVCWNSARVSSSAWRSEAQRLSDCSWWCWNFATSASNWIWVVSWVGCLNKNRWKRREIRFDPSTEREKNKKQNKTNHWKLCNLSHLASLSFNSSLRRFSSSWPLELTCSSIASALSKARRVESSDCRRAFLASPKSSFRSLFSARSPATSRHMSWVCMAVWMSPRQHPGQVGYHKAWDRRTLSPWDLGWVSWMSVRT